LLLVKPRALDVKKANAGEPRECERVKRELRDRLIGAGVGLVVENVDGAVAHLEKVNVTVRTRGSRRFRGHGHRRSLTRDRLERTYPCPNLRENPAPRRRPRSASAVVPWA
jgi:hypothetical protein